MEPVSKRTWHIRQVPEEEVRRLLADCGLSRIVATVLVNRGIIDPDEVRRFLSSGLGDLHDPMSMLDMDRAVDRLMRAIRDGERICIYGDYDVDGVTSVSLLTSFLRVIGADCFYHIPHRLEDGYGLSAEGIARAEEAGAKVIVTADCGITACHEAELCREKNIDLIITDHHTPPEKLPLAHAVVNPLRVGCAFPCKALAGVGVAFNLVMALRGKLRGEGYFASRTEPNLRQYLDIVALGTIADIVPLVDDNRIFVKHGLKELSASTRIGIKALKSVAGVNGEVGCGSVGFRLAPRLNAAGRLEDAAIGVELLLSDDAKQAAAMAADLDASNTERQAVEQEILRDAVSLINGNAAMRGRKSIVLASEEWHPGVIGIVASRIVDLFHRPTVLIALQNGNGKGSGRSIPAFHLHDALTACSEHLLKFGGHKYAAGLSIEEATLDLFVKNFEEIAVGNLSEEDLVPRLAIDAEVSPEELTMALVRDIEVLAPFGMGNPEPVFVMRGVKILERRVLRDRHLKLKLAKDKYQFEAIGFQMADREVSSDQADIAFTISENDWNGVRTVQLKLKDVKSMS